MAEVHAPDDVDGREPGDCHGVGGMPRWEAAHHMAQQTRTCISFRVQLWLLGSHSVCLVHIHMCSAMSPALRCARPYKLQCWYMPRASVHCTYKVRQQLPAYSSELCQSSKAAHTASTAARTHSVRGPYLSLPSFTSSRFGLVQAPATWPKCTGPRVVLDNTGGRLLA